MKDLKKLLEAVLDKHIPETDRKSRAFRRKMLKFMLNSVDRLLTGDGLWTDVLELVEASVEFWFNRSSDISGPSHALKMDLLLCLQSYLKGRVDKFTERVIANDIAAAKISD